MPVYLWRHLLISWLLWLCRFRYSTVMLMANCAGEVETLNKTNRREVRYRYLLAMLDFNCFCCIVFRCWRLKKIYLNFNDAQYRLHCNRVIKQAYLKCRLKCILQINTSIISHMSWTLWECVSISKNCWIIWKYWTTVGMTICKSSVATFLHLIARRRLS